MKRRSYNSDEGIILKKIRLKDQHQLVTIFSKNNGRINLTGFGTKKITSRRLSHLETGNVIKFSYREKDEYMTLQETELMYAHSKIKEDPNKLDMMFGVFFVLNRMLPEKQAERNAYDYLLRFLRKIHSADLEPGDFDDFLKFILLDQGFIDKEELNSPQFDSVKFTESLIGAKITERSIT